MGPKKELSAIEQSRNEENKAISKDDMVYSDSSDSSEQEEGLSKQVRLQMKKKKKKLAAKREKEEFERLVDI